MLQLKELLRDPLEHFLIIGALIYDAYGWLGSESADEDARTVTISSGDIEALTGQWTRLYSRPPTREELAGLIKKHVRTQILYREAKAMGLDQQDQVIERRLAQKVELLSKSLVTPAPPPDEVLLAWYADNTDQFREPDAYTLSQVFFDPDQRDNALEDARAALNKLQQLTDVPADLAGYGDDSIVQNYYAGRTSMELRRTLGSGFVDQVTTLAPGSWHGPVLSGFGVHLVFVHGVKRPDAPGLADIRDAVQEAWMLEQVDALSERFLDELISRYDVVVEETSVPMTVPPSQDTE